ncbi:hypothetical protein PENTCL1PPCAC_823, partial [Pristionchus entomophagus]
VSATLETEEARRCLLYLKPRASTTDLCELTIRHNQTEIFDMLTEFLGRTSVERVNIYESRIIEDYKSLFNLMQHISPDYCKHCVLLLMPDALEFVNSLAGISRTIYIDAISKIDSLPD